MLLLNTLLATLVLLTLSIAPALSAPQPAAPHVGSPCYEQQARMSFCSGDQHVSCHIPQGDPQGIWMAGTCDYGCTAFSYGYAACNDCRPGSRQCSTSLPDWVNVCMWFPQAMKFVYQRSEQCTHGQRRCVSTQGGRSAGCG